MVATNSGSFTTMETVLERGATSGTRTKVEITLEGSLAKQGLLATTLTTQGGGNPNLWFGNARGGYKRGSNEREGYGDQREH
jgi:hypothetical protein